MKDAKGHGSDGKGGGRWGNHPDDRARASLGARWANHPDTRARAALDAGSIGSAMDAAERNELGSLHSSNQDAAAASTLAAGHPKAVAAPVHAGASGRMFAHTFGRAVSAVRGAFNNSDS